MSAVGKSEPAASSLDAYLHSCQNDRVCLLFGLRRTGKTTMLRQAVLDMAPENAAKTAYIKATVLDTIAALNRDMKRPRAGELNFDDDSVNAEDAADKHQQVFKLQFADGAFDMVVYDAEQDRCKI